MLEPMPLSLGDFLYGHAEGCTIDGSLDQRVDLALHRIAELRGADELPDNRDEFVCRLQGALQKRIDREQRQKTEPLPLFPDWAQPILNALPFRGLVDVPFRLYSGHIPPGDILPLLAQQIGWALALIVLGRTVLARGTRRLVVQGG